MSTVKKDENIVYFKLYKFSTDVDVIHKILQITEAQGWNAGSIMEDRKRPVECNYWELKSQLNTSDDLTDHLDWILEKMLPKMEELLFIYETYHVFPELAIVSYTYNRANPHFCIELEKIETIYALGASIYFDFYNLVDENSQCTESIHSGKYQLLTQEKMGKLKKTGCDIHKLKQYP